MARRAMPNYHVWHWNGERFEVVWHDITRKEAFELADWRNERAILQGSVTRYVVAVDGRDPVLP